jgi:hypothetical protein
MERFKPVRDERLRSLCRYWLTLRGDRVMPKRGEIDATAIGSVLPYVWLYEFVPPDRFRCRLIGEEIANLYRPSPRGRYIDEIFPTPHAREVTERFMTMIRRRQASRTVGDCILSNDRSVFGERITLPLSSDGINADGLVGATIYALTPAEIGTALVHEHLSVEYIDIAQPNRMG